MIDLSRVVACVSAVCVLLVMAAPVLHAEPLKRVMVAEGVYALVGSLEQRSASNLGNNATFGVVLTDAGVLLIDSGGTAAGAQAIEQQIAELTEAPVRWVINTGGQDHRWFGNHYFTQQGAETWTSALTHKDQIARVDAQVERMRRNVGDAWVGTEPEPANNNIDEPTQMQFGDRAVELIPLGPTHSGGELAVWLPNEGVLFAGDLVYLNRMLRVGDHSDHLNWLEAFERIRALDPTWIVPGHGTPAPIETAVKDTYDYLRYLRSEVGRLLDEGEGMEASAGIDQSAWQHLQGFESLKGQNAQAVFEQMEWE